MRLAPVIVFFVIVASHAPVYVKGHSEAADKVRAKLAAFTCYRAGAEAQNAAATLQVDHLLSKSGRSWVVIALVDGQQHVLWIKKA